MNRYINRLKFKRSYRKIFNNVKQFASEESYNAISNTIRNNNDVLLFDISSNALIEFANYITTEFGKNSIMFASDPDKFLKMKYDYSYAGTMFHKAYISISLYAEVIKLLNRCNLKIADGNIICRIYDKLICAYDVEENNIEIGVYSHIDENGMYAKFVLSYEFDELYNETIHKSFRRVINGLKFYEGNEKCQSLLSDLKINYKNFITGNFDNKINHIISYDHNKVIRIVFCADNKSDNCSELILYRDMSSGVYTVILSNIQGEYYSKANFTKSLDFKSLKDEYFYRYGINQILQIDTDIFDFILDNKVLRYLSNIYINDNDEIVCI